MFAESDFGFEDFKGTWERQFGRSKSQVFQFESFFVSGIHGCKISSINLHIIINNCVQIV